MMSPWMRFDKLTWGLLSKVHVLFAALAAAAILSSIDVAIEARTVVQRMAEKGHTTGVDIAWVQIIGKPAVLFFYACACFLLREIVLTTAARLGIVHDDVALEEVGSTISRWLMAAAKPLAYFFVCFGIFAVANKIVFDLGIEGRTVLTSLYFGLRTATEQWFYAAVLFVLLLVLEAAQTEEQS